MGEKIKTLGSVQINCEKFEIELNHPPSMGQGRQIHIQSEKFRCELEEEEFIRVAVAVRLAAEKLRYSKKLK